MLTVAPDPHDFGSATLGTTTPATTFTVRNIGTAPSEALAISVSDSSSYTVSGGTCAGVTLSVGASCTVLVAFAPTGEPGTKPATLKVTLAPPVTLTGVALGAGQLVVESAPIDFGTVALGAESDEAAIALHNAGQSPSGSISLQLSDDADFVVSSNTCAAGLAAGARCTIGVRFKPATVGVKDGVSLTASAQPGGAAPVALSGTGTAKLTVTRTGTGTGSVTSQPPAIDCGTTCEASFTVPSVTLTATADAQSTFTSWSLATCPAAPTCNVPIDAARTVSANFTLRPANLALAPRTQDFGSIALGASSLPVTFTLTNRGGAATGTIAATVDDTASYQVSGGTCIGAKLGGGGKACTVMVVFHPVGGVGKKPAALTVTAAGSPALTSTLSGTALTVAALTVDPTSKVFDPIAIGGAGPEAIFTVTNGGDTASGPLGVALSDTSSFTISSNDCTSALASHATCHVGIKLTPGAIGEIQGVSLTISGTPGGAVPASLQGTGTANLTVTSAGGGTVVSDPAGIDCHDTCTATFTASPVHLTATPDALHDFTGWAGSGCAGTGDCDAALVAASQSVTATFVARPAKLAVAPTTQSFGSVTIGAASTPVTFTVTNTGGGASGAIAATVDDGASYGVTGGTCPGASIAAGATCTVTVRFNPAAPAGAKPATLTVSAAPGGSAPATLTGTALSPASVTITPTTNNFGSVALGASSATVPFAVKNGGQSPTGPLTVALSGANANQFAVVSNDCPASLPANGSCTVGVKLAPTAVGAKVATLTASASPGGSAPAALQGTGTSTVKITKVGGGTVTSTPGGITCGNACTASFSAPMVTLTAVADPSFNFTSWMGSGCSGSGPCTVTLDAAEKDVTATFTAKPASLTMAPGSQDFGSRAIGTSSSTVPFTVTNGGGAPSGAISASVNDTGNYTVVDGSCLGASLAAGASCTVNVKFNPIAPTGAKPGTLTASASPGGAPTASLTGTALSAAALALTPSPTDFGSVAAGATSAVKSFTLKNNGQAASGTLTIALGGSAASSFTVASNDCPTTLAASATCTIGVRFAPASIAAKSATLTASATPGGSSSATLTGTGTVRVSVSVNGSGTVSSTPPGLTCSAGTCMHDFAQANVSLSETPGATFVFSTWGGACTGAGACNLTLSTAATSVTAAFGCAGGESVCNGLCVDLTSDENHCGACTNVCVAQSCVAGVCETTVTPDPTFPVGVSVLGLWASASNDLWAVGSVGQNNPAIVHWDGSTWTSVPSGIAQGCGLAGVWGTAANDIWAADGCGGRVTHWDGAQWTQEGENPAPTFALAAIWASSPDDVWVAGQGGLIMHKTGGHWGKVQLPGNPQMESIWGTSATNIWAGGGLGSLFHWDGGSWTKMPTGLPASTGDVIEAIRGFNANDVWAAGSAGIVLHFNGTAWGVVLADSQLTGAELDFIGGSGDNDLFIGGFDGVLFHKSTGTAWTPLPTPPDPNNPGGFKEPRAVWSNGPGDTWIGGFTGLMLHSP